jgi:hypothetical protein
MNSCSPEVMYPSSKVLMTLEESHLQADIMRTEDLWMPDSYGYRVSWPLSNCIFRKRNYKKGFHKIQCTNVEPRISGRLTKSHFPAAKILNSCSMKARYPWSEGLITLELSHFKFAKKSMSGWQETSCPGMEDLTTLHESLFRPPKWRKVVRRNPCILQPRVSWTLKKIIVRPPNDRKVALWMLDTWDHWRNSFSGRQNAEQRLC